MPIIDLAIAVAINPDFELTKARNHRLLALLHNEKSCAQPDQTRNGSDQAYAYARRLHVGLKAAYKNADLILADGTPVNGVNALRDYIVGRPDLFVQTLTENLLTYALGRPAQYYDMPLVRRLVGASDGTDELGDGDTPAGAVGTGDGP